MAKEIVNDVSQTATTSSTVIPTMSVGTTTTTVTSDISTNVTTCSTNSDPLSSVSNASIDVASLSRTTEIKSESSPPSITTIASTDDKNLVNDSLLENMKLDHSRRLSLTKIEPVFLKSDYVIESSRNIDSSNNTMPSIPTITTQTVVNNNYKITPSELSSVESELKILRHAVIKSKSKYELKLKLTSSLERIFSFVIATRFRMSQVQANQINNELKSIVKKRRKIEFNERKRRKNVEYCMGCFLITIMLSRMISDVYCAIQFNKSELIIHSRTAYLLVVQVLGFIFTSFILVSFCCMWRIGNIEIGFCIIWTTLYGIITTIVIVISPNKTPLEIIICGYLSMITCIIQGCLKVYYNCKNGSSDEKCQCKKSEISNFVITQCPDNSHLDPRISAIKDLESTIKEFLSEINGSEYLDQERFQIAEKKSYVSQQQFDNNGSHNEMMTHAAANQALILNTTTNATNSDSVVGCNDWFCCCYFSNPSHHDCLPFLFCYGSNNECCISNSDNNDCCGDCNCCCDGCEDCDCGDCAGGCADCAGGGADCAGCIC